MSRARKLTRHGLFDAFRTKPAREASFMERFYAERVATGTQSRSSIPALRRAPFAAEPPSPIGTGEPLRESAGRASGKKDR